MNKNYIFTFLQYLLITCLLFAVIYLFTYPQQDNILAIYVEGGSSHFTSDEFDEAHNKIIDYFDKKMNGAKINEIIYLGDSESREVGKTYNYEKAALFTVGFEKDKTIASLDSDPNSKNSSFKVLLYQNEQNKWEVDKRL